MRDDYRSLDAISHSVHIGYVQRRLKDATRRAEQAEALGLEPDPSILPPQAEQRQMTATEIVYLRCGDLPLGGKSRNHLTGELESGVSVYEGIVRGGEAFIILPTASASACVSLSGCIEEPVYQVTGRVVGYGSDGEPLLTDCSIVRPLWLHGQEGNTNA